MPCAMLIKVIIFIYLSYFQIGKNVFNILLLIMMLKIVLKNVIIFYFLKEAFTHILLVLKNMNEFYKFIFSI